MFNRLTTGERVKDLRIKQGLTLKELSAAIEKKTGVHLAPSTLSDLEAYGNTDKANKEPRLSTLKAITDYFDISLDYLAGNSEVKSPSLTKQAIHKMLGLSEAAILQLQTANRQRMAFVLLALEELISANDLYTLDTFGQYLTMSDDTTIERANGQRIKERAIAALDLQQSLDDIRRMYKEKQVKTKER